jgi:hypothetical protein
MRNFLRLFFAAAFAAMLAVAATGCGGSASPANTTTSRTNPGGTPVATPSKGATAFFTLKGEKHTFTNGRCSSVLDSNQFLFRDPPNPGVDATYFALTVTDAKPGAETTGGKHKGALTYQQDGKLVANVAGDLELDIAPDLKSGTFTGPDFLTKETLTGGYAC